MVQSVAQSHRMMLLPSLISPSKQTKHAFLIIISVILLQNSGCGPWDSAIM